MANRNLRQFKADGCMYLVNLAHDATLPDGIYGPFFTTKEVRAARALVDGHERGNRVCDEVLRPQVCGDRDVNPLTR